MELKEFIKDSIVQIIDAVGEAKEAHSELVSPVSNNKNNRSETIRNRKLIHDIKFDIAVTVEEENGSDGKGKISVLGASIGGGISEKDKLTTVTRIKFDVPVSYK